MNGESIKAKYKQDKALHSDQLCKLYMELANIVPKDCISSREIRLGKIADTYGLALLMIREGAENPLQLAREALERVKDLTQ